MSVVSMMVLIVIASLSSVAQDGRVASETCIPPWEELGARVRRNDSGEVTWLMVTGPKVTDKDLENASDLTSLEVLVLGNTEPRKDGWCLGDLALANIGRAQRLITLQLRGKGFSDRSMPKIEHLTNLRNLELSHTQVTDDGLQVLSRLSCTYLDMAGTNITGKGLAHIEEWKRLSHLNLEDTHVGNEALEHVSRLKSLKTLDLNNTRVTDEGVKRLSSLSALERLDLSFVSITDAGVRYLETLKRIKWLSLAGTRVTDAAIPSLVKLRELRDLDVSNTAVTESGIERLGKSLPNVRIWSDERVIDEGKDL